MVDTKKIIQKRNYRNLSRTNRNKDFEASKKETFVFQTCVSIIMVFIVICISLVKTNYTQSIRERLKNALSTQVSIDTVKDAGMLGVNKIKEVGNFFENSNQPSDNLKTDETTTEEDIVPQIYMENEGQDISEDVLKNQEPPEVILPEN